MAEFTLTPPFCVHFVYPCLTNLASVCKGFLHDEIGSHVLKWGDVSRPTKLGESDKPFTEESSHPISKSIGAFFKTDTNASSYIK